MRSHWRTWLISAVAARLVAAACGTTTTTAQRWHRHRGGRRHDRRDATAPADPSRAPRSPSPSAPSRPASTRTSSTTAVSGRSTTTSTRPCSPARPTASCPRPRHRVADAGRRHDLGVHAPRRRHVPQRRAVQRRLRRGHDRADDRPRRARRDRQRRLLRHAHRRRRRSTSTRCRSRPTALTACSRRACTGSSRSRPSAEETPDLSDAPIGTGPYRSTSRNQGVDIKLAANADYWGDAPTVGKVTYEFCRRRRDPPRRADLGRLRPDHQPRAADVEQAPAVRRPCRARSTRSSSSTPTRASPPTSTSARRSTSPSTRTPSPRARSAASPPSTPGSCCRRRSSATTRRSSRTPTTRRRPQRLLEEAGVAGETIQLVGESGRWLKDRELFEAVAGYWTEAGLDVQLEVLEFGAYLDVLFDRENRADAIYVSSSNDLLDPDRQLATYYEAGGIGSSNSNEELAGLIAAGPHRARSRSPPEHLPAGAADRLRRGLLRLARQQRGHLRHVRAAPVDATGRRQAARRGDERRRVTRTERPMGVFMTERSGNTHRCRARGAEWGGSSAHGWCRARSSSSA